MQIRIKRAYETASADDGRRVLVDRLWPRGVSKEAAAVDAWAKDLAPSPELRRWFDHDPSKFNAFAERYRAELAERQADAEALLRETDGDRLTLVYGAKDETHNHAAVLAEFLRGLAG